MRAVPDERESRAARALALLREGDGELFGILDAARDELVVPYLYGSGLQFQSLYEGLKGEELALVAPYLTSFSPDTPALGELIEQAWGESWGVFLRTTVPFRDLRRHLRRLLRVELEGDQRVLFRFYDPRVLRAYLPTCTGAEAAQVFGPVTLFLTEGRRGESALRFRATHGGVAVDTVALMRDPEEEARPAR